MVSKSFFFILFLSFMALAPTTSALSEVDDCTVPKDNLRIARDTVLCPGNHFVLDLFADGALIISADDVVLDCNNAHFYGLRFVGYGINASGYKNVSIKNCFISRYGVGVLSSNSENIALFNNKIYDAGIGLLLRNSSQTSVFNNNFNNLRGYGVSDGNSSNLSIFNNAFSDVIGGYGLESYGSIGLNIHDNAFFNLTGQGISLGAATRPSFFNNSIYNSTFYALKIIDSRDALVVGNKIRDINEELYYGASGMYFFNLNDSIISGNAIFNATHIGLYLMNSYDSAIYDNIIEKNDAGLRIHNLYGGLSNISVYRNRLINNGYGIDITQSDGNELRSNYVCWNQHYDVFNSRSMQQNKGVGNTCDKTVDWKDEGFENGCAFACTQDITPPAITNATSVPNPVKRGNYTLFTARITDDTGVDDSSVFAHIQYVDEVDLRVVQLYDDGTNGDAVAKDSIYTNYYHLQKRVDSGQYKIDIAARDLAGNQAEFENAVIVSVLP